MKILSNNDWDPLKEIIVGRADKARVPTVDLSTMSMSYTNYDIEKIKPLQECLVLVNQNQCQLLV